jgi:hypothetical protein
MTGDLKAATTGRCMCGDIRFEYRGAPIEITHCHCESCRRHSSSAFVTFVVVDKAGFRYTRGAPVAYASSPGVERTHCGRCGAPISYENAEEFALYACTLDDPTVLKPENHIFVAEKMPWIEIGDSLPQFEYSAKGAAPVRCGPGRPA